MRVAMVCLGNICRSPMAWSVARSLVSDAGLSAKVTIESFGTAGYHVGEDMDRRAATVLRRRGWSPDGHRARRISAPDLAGLDLALAADRSNLADLHRLARGLAPGPEIRLLRTYDPDSGVDDEVPDPWFGDASGFDDVLDVIEAACRGLVPELARTFR